METIGRYKPGQNITVRPNGELAGDQLKAGRFVVVSGYGDDQCYLADHAAPGEAHPLGVTQRDSAKPNVEDKRSVDLLVEVMTGGIPRVEAGEEIPAQSDVAIGEDGKAVVAAGDVAATLKTGVVASNNAITWTSRLVGADGNDISVTIVDPVGNNVALSVDVDGHDIEVILATDGASAPTSTATLVLAAIKEHDTASQLVNVANTAGSSGAGVMVAAGKASLAGGSTAEGPTAAVGQALTGAAASGDIIEVQPYY